MKNDPIIVYNILDTTDETMVLAFSDGTKCKMSKAHMRALYRFLKAYFTAKKELDNGII